MRFIFILAALFGTLTHTGAALAARSLEVIDSSERHALVIGNNAYLSTAPLEKAGNDALAMGKSLERIGYRTTVLIDANRRQMNTAINRFVENITGGGEGVLFFAGHGVQINNQNFLLPVDIDNPRHEADVGDQAISLQSVQDKIAQAHPRFTLLVIDACRNNPLPQRAGRNLGGTRGLALASSAEGQMVIFSAGANQLALDKLHAQDANPNGLFTRELLPWLEKPGVSVRQAMLEVRRSVHTKAKEVNHDQFPAVYDQVLGDFYFLPKSAVTASVRPVQPDVPPPSTSAAESPKTARPVSLGLEAVPIKPAAPTGMLQETPVAAAPPPHPVTSTAILAYAGLGIPGYRHFWRGEKREGYTRRLNELLARTGAQELALQANAAAAEAFDKLWNDPDLSAGSRSACSTNPAPRALLLARVETAPALFTDIESAYWPELKMQLVDCASLKIQRQQKSLAPRKQDEWPFATDLAQELSEFLRNSRNTLSN
jgi:hypothetical protein